MFYSTIMIKLLEIVDKVLEPILVYTFSGIYFSILFIGLEKIDMAVNILLGLVVLSYTILKAVELFIKLRQAREEYLEEKNKED